MKSKIKTVWIVFFTVTLFLAFNVKTPAQSASPFWTGNGGKGASITILAPRVSGLAENQNYLPNLVQGELVSNFSSYSAIAVLDRVRLDEQYAEILSGYYADNAQAGSDLGHLLPTDFILGGNITRTSSGFALQLWVTKSADKTTAASYSGACSFDELDNLSGVRRASLDLLQKLGVTPTSQARTELAGAASVNHVNAQTALARGITAQKSGTEVAALSYYYQAAAFDSSFLEAAGRAQVMSADISSGNIGNVGANVRNDIAWRRAWIERLSESERYFDNFFKTQSLPYTLFYSTDIKQGAINYQTETAALSIDVNLHHSGVWADSVEQALETVYKGLDATKRKSDWGLAGWPGTGVTNLKPFVAGSKTFAVSADLLNEQDQIIGRQNFTVKGNWSWKNTTLEISPDDMQTITFANIKADDITDKLTLRIASVNGVSAQTAAQNGVLQIRTVTGNEFDNWLIFTFSKGVITGWKRDNRKDLFIPGTIWGDPVKGFGKDVFYKSSLASVTIGNGVTSIGEWAFWDCSSLVSVTIGNSVTSIGNFAFSDCKNLTSVTIGNSVTSIGKAAFDDCFSLANVIIPNSVTSIWDFAFNDCRNLTSVTIGNGVTSIGYGAFEGCRNLASVIIPNSVTSIGDMAFYDCRELVSVTIGSGVKSIGDNAFNNCGELARITIPNSVTSIGKFSFSCYKLASVTFQGTIPSGGFDEYAFDIDLRKKFYAANARNGTPGTYKTSNPGAYSPVWTRQ